MAAVLEQNRIHIYDLFCLFLGPGFGFNGCVPFPGWDGGKVSQGANCKVQDYVSETS